MSVWQYRAVRMLRAMNGFFRQSGSEPHDGATPTDPGSGQIRQAGYRIRIEGHLEDRWANDNEGLTVMLEETGNTLLIVPVIDQAALHGLLRRLRDLGMRLISINPVGADLQSKTSKEES